VKKYFVSCNEIINLIKKERKIPKLATILYGFGKVFEDE